MIKHSSHFARVHSRYQHLCLEPATQTFATRRANHHGAGGDGEARQIKHIIGMNNAQRKAVQFPPSTSLQILAGPGSGKTRVLTSRIIELVNKHSIHPSSICAVTFTRRAATEMQNRLNRDLGSDAASQILLGTFHRVCNRYLRDHGAAIKLSPDFLIWDEEECETLIYYILERYKPGVKRKVAEQLKQIISAAKSVLGRSPEDILKEQTRKAENKLFLDVYRDYSSVLATSNAFDFDDLLNKGLEVVQTVPWASGISKLQHLLVDEYQDTSSVQFQLIRELYKATKGHVSVVGDPDQSIYGWRNAGLTSLDQIEKDLPNTRVLYLEENYRSTASILATSLAIISQDPTRPNKSLFTSRGPAGPKPVLKKFSDSTAESIFIAGEIQRIVDSSNGVLGYGQCAILVRDNYVSDELIEALKAGSIPYRILPDLSRFERPEIKTLLAYIRLGLNSANTPLLVRVLEGPHKIDKEDIAKLVERSIKGKIPMFDLLEGICTKSTTDLNRIKTQLEQCVGLIKHMKILLDQGAPPADFIKHIIDTIDYEGYLDSTAGKLATWRKNNVQSFLKFARNFYQPKSDIYIPPIQGFLNLLNELSKANNADVGKVTILTCHSSKGLEWPVVFIPEVVDGVHPHHMTEDIDEARRLLYVACTRAQCLLYLTHSGRKMIGRGAGKEKLNLTISDFVNDVEPTLFQSEPPHLGEQELKLFQDIIGPGRRSKLSTPE